MFLPQFNCLQNNSKSRKRILLKFSGNVNNGMVQGIDDKILVLICVTVWILELF